MTITAKVVVLGGKADQGMDLAAVELSRKGWKRISARGIMADAAETLFGRDGACGQLPPQSVYPFEPEAGNLGRLLSGRLGFGDGEIVEVAAIHTANYIAETLELDVDPGELRFFVLADDDGEDLPGVLKAVLDELTSFHIIVEAVEVEAASIVIDTARKKDAGKPSGKFMEWLRRLGSRRLKEWVFEEAEIVEMVNALGRGTYLEIV